MGKIPLSKNCEIVFYNGEAESPGYELLEIEPKGTTEKEIMGNAKPKIIEYMGKKYGLKWDGMNTKSTYTYYIYPD